MKPAPVILAAVLAAGCDPAGQPSTEEAAGAFPGHSHATTPNRLVVPVGIVAEARVGEIIGTLTNTTSARLTQLTIAFSNYDENGAKVGESYDTITTLESGETWAFRCPVYERTARRVRLLAFAAAGVKYPTNFRWEGKETEPERTARLAQERETEQARTAHAASTEAYLARQREARIHAEKERREEAIRKFRAEQSTSPQP